MNTPNKSQQSSRPAIQIAADVELDGSKETGSWRRIVIAAVLFVVVIGTPIALFFSIHLDSKNKGTQRNGLLKISRMLAKYAGRNGAMPASTSGDPHENRYSWRLQLGNFDDVIIPPHLKATYREYRFEEPWNSAHNRALLQQVQEYSGPQTKLGYAQFLAVKGLGTMWQPSGQRPPCNMPILISYPESDIAWTEPRDVILKSSKLYFESADGSPKAIELSGIMILWGDESITAIRKHPKYNDADRKLMLLRLRNEYVPHE